MGAPLRFTAEAGRARDFPIDALRAPEVPLARPPRVSAGMQETHTSSEQG